MQVLDKLWA